MNALFTPNDGERTSQLDLARYATGEMSDDERAQVEAALDHPGAREFLETLEVAKSKVEPFDPAILRARSHRVEAETPARAPEAPAAPWWRRWMPVWLPTAALVALALLVMRPASLPGETAPDVRVRGSEELLLYVLDQEALVPYDGEALGAGDVIGFQLRPDGSDRFTLLSMDGNGTLTVFYPAHGDAPAAVPSSAPQVPLPGSLTLDDAPGPEVFVVALDPESVDAVRAEAEARFARGGAQALLDWGRTDPSVDAVSIAREAR